MHHFDKACSEDQTVWDYIEGIVAPEVRARQLCHSEEPKTIEYLLKSFIAVQPSIQEVYNCITVITKCHQQVLHVINPSI